MQNDKAENGSENIVSALGSHFCQNYTIVKRITFFKKNLPAPNPFIRQAHLLFNYV
jgi:hypothetical protein